MRVERKIEHNKRILSIFKENLTSEEKLSSETGYRTAANFRKKYDITEHDIKSVNQDKARLKSLEQLADKINEQSGESSSSKNS
jgi:septation ring formation regulator EzrA